VQPIETFLTLNLLAVIPIIVSWHKNKTRSRKTPLVVYIASLIPAGIVFWVFIYDQFFWRGGGVPGHQYLVLLFTPFAMILALGYLISILIEQRKGKKGD